MFMEVKLSVASDSESVDHAYVIVQPKRLSFAKCISVNAQRVTVSSMIFIAFYDSIDTDVYF